MNEERWYKVFIGDLLTVQVAFLFWTLLNLGHFFQEWQPPDYPIEPKSILLSLLEWQYWPDLIRANVYLVIWMFMWNYCFFRNISRQRFKLLSILMLFSLIPLALINFSLIREWPEHSMALSCIVLFAVIILISGLYNLASVCLKSTNFHYIKILFSTENSRMAYEFLLIAFIIALFGEISIQILWGSSSNYVLNVLFDKRGILVVIISIMLLKVAWNHRYRFRAWLKAVSMSKNLPSKSMLPVYVVVDSVGPLTRSTIFDFATDREQQREYGFVSGRNIIEETEKIKYNHLKARIVVLSPDLWNTLQVRIKSYRHLHIHVQLSSDFLLSLCDTSILKEHIGYIKTLFLSSNTLILSNHQQNKRKAGRSGQSRNDNWTSTIKDISINSDNMYQDIDKFLHYLPEKIHTTVEEFLSVESIWQNLEKTAERSLSELKSVLPEIFSHYLEKIQNERNLVEIFYGLSKTLEMMIHFFALVAVAQIADTPSKRRKVSFKAQFEGASIGRWFEIGKKYSEQLDQNSPLSQWWNGNLTQEIKLTMQKLLAGVGTRLNRLSFMRDMHEFVVTFRNKTSGHGVLTYQAASEALQNLAIITGGALSFAAKTKIRLVKSSGKLFIALDNSEIDISDLLYQENGRYYILSAYHGGFPEFICYQTGDVVMAEGLRIRLDE